MLTVWLLTLSRNNQQKDNIMNRILLRLCAVALCVGGLVLPDTATAGLKLSRDVILAPASTEMPQYIGVYGGLAMNYHSGTFSLTDGNTVCCTFTDGDGLGFVGGVKGFFSVIENLYYSPRLALEEGEVRLTEISIRTISVVLLTRLNRLHSGMTSKCRFQP